MILQVQIQVKLKCKYKSKNKNKFKNKYKCKCKQEVINSDKNAMQKWISKCDSKGTEITLSIENKEQLEIKAASNIKLKFNSDTQTAKSVPTFRTSIFWEKSNYWDKHSLETRVESESDIREFNTYSLCTKVCQNWSSNCLISVWTFDNGDRWGILSQLCFGKASLLNTALLLEWICAYLLAPNMLLRLAQRCKPIKSSNSHDWIVNGLCLSSKRNVRWHVSFPYCFSREILTWFLALSMPQNLLVVHYYLCGLLLECIWKVWWTTRKMKSV